MDRKRKQDTSAPSTKQRRLKFNVLKYRRNPDDDIPRDNTPDARGGAEPMMIEDAPSEPLLHFTQYYPRRKMKYKRKRASYMTPVMPLNFNLRCFVEGADVSCFLFGVVYHGADIVYHVSEQYH